MKREKAIEILTLNINEHHRKMPPDVFDALKIAVSDMTYVYNIRRFPHEADNLPIPGDDPE